MAFDLEKYYRELKLYYQMNDAAVEYFLKESADQCLQDAKSAAVNGVMTGDAAREYVSVCNELACFYKNSGRSGEALAVLERLGRDLEKNGRGVSLEHAMALYDKALIFMDMGSSSEGIHTLSAAADMVEQSVEDRNDKLRQSAAAVLAGIYNSMGLALQAEGRGKEALEAFEKALALIPDTPEFKQERGITRENLLSARKHTEE